MLAEVLVAACSAARLDRSVLARVGGPIGERVRAIGDADRRDRAVWAAQARAPVPAGLRGVHASWIEAALAALPERARADVAAAGGDAVAVWLARWACAAMPPMPALRDGAGWPTSVDEACALDARELRRWLARIGADQVAALAATGGVEAPSLREAIARVQAPPRAGQLGPARAIVERCRGASLDEQGLARIGARAIAPYVAATPLARSILVHRLPRSYGLAIGEELLVHAGDPVDRCPSWRALAAD